MLLDHQIVSAWLTYISAQPEHATKSSLRQLFGVRGIVEMYKSAKLGQETYETQEIAMLQALLVSFPNVVFLAIYSLKNPEWENQSELYFVIYISMCVSIINVARAASYNDTLGLKKQSIWWTGFLIIWRITEIAFRMSIWATVSAYTINFAFTGYVAGLFLITAFLRGREAGVSLGDLFYYCGCCCQRNRVHMAPHERLNRLRNFVNTFQTSVLDTVVFDLSHQGVAKWSNYYKVIETFIFLGILYSRAHGPGDTFKSTEHVEFTCRDFSVLLYRLGWLLGVNAFTGLLVFGCNQYDTEDYRNAMARRVRSLIKAEKWTVIESFILRKQIVRLTVTQNRRIRQYGNVTLSRLQKQREFTPDEIWRLHFPIQEVLSRIEWSKLKVRTEEILQNKADCTFKNTDDENAIFQTLDELIHHFIGSETVQTLAPRKESLAMNKMAYNYKMDQEDKIFIGYRKRCCAKKKRIVMWGYDYQNSFEDMEFEENYKGNEDCINGFTMKPSTALFIDPDDAAAFTPSENHPTDRWDTIHILREPKTADDAMAHWHVLDCKSPNHFREAQTQLERNMAMTEFEHIVTDNSWVELERQATTELQDDDDDNVPLKREKSVRDLDKMSWGYALDNQREINLSCSMSCKEIVMGLVMNVGMLPCTLCGFLNYQSYCGIGGIRLSMEQMMEERDEDGKFLANDGDIFLFSTAKGGWLPLVQGGHWAHAGIIYRFQKRHLPFMPRRFRVQLEDWYNNGLIDEKHPLVFEMTCHDREIKSGYNVHLTRLDKWFAYKCIPEYWGATLGIRHYIGRRDRHFYDALFRTMRKHHKKPYEKNYTELACTSLCYHKESDEQYLFCSELVACFHQELGILDFDVPTNHFQPSDYGSAKGLCPLQFMICCCLTYCGECRITKHHRDLHSKLDQLWLLDNSSIDQWKEIVETRKEEFREELQTISPNALVGISDEDYQKVSSRKSLLRVGSRGSLMSPAVTLELEEKRSIGGESFHDSTQSIELGAKLTELTTLRGIDLSTSDFASESQNIETVEEGLPEERIAHI